MYLNDFQTDNAQFIADILALELGETISFKPIGKEYCEYTITRSKLCNCFFFALYENTSEDVSELFSTDPRKFGGQLEKYLAKHGITRVTYKKVGVAQ